MIRHRDQDTPRFHPPLRRGREARGRTQTGTLLRRLCRQATTRRPGWRQRTWRGMYVPPSRPASQRVVVKAQVVKPRMSGHRSWKAALGQHLEYIQREGVALGGEHGQLFTSDTSGIEPAAFLRRSAADPHQFRLIVSPERGDALDLVGFTRSLMTQVEADVGTRLDWVAVNHYDTAHPHTHILVRGIDAEGQALAMQRGYIAQGIRFRAQDIATRELGYRLDQAPSHDVARARTHDPDLNL